MARSDPFDVALIGSGPAGYVAAIRGAQLGLKVAIVEQDELGGVCLNWGCIPSKALLKNAEIVSYVQRADEFGLKFTNFEADYEVAVRRSRRVVKKLTTGVAGLLRKNKVEVIKGRGTIASPSSIAVEGGDTVEAKNLMIATGGRPRLIPGIEIDGEVVVTSREAIVQTTIPKRVVIVGGGAIGAEFAYICRTYGAEVTIVEQLPRLLPQEDEDISKALKKAFTKAGIDVMTGSSIIGIAKRGKTAKVAVSNDGGDAEITAGRVIIAIGVQGNSEGIGLDEAGVRIESGFVPVNDVMQTNVSGIYAIGDITGPPLLAHVAFRQGELAMEHIAGHETKPLDYPFMPRATYCQPQVASFGHTEAEARALGHDVAAFSFPFGANGKALALGETEGFAKIVIDKRYGELLGAHLIGPEVTELLPEMSLARELEGSILEIGESVHAHPTLSEALKEAALGVLGRAIHI